MTTLKSYKLAEVKKHDKANDAWVTCGGYVHDITSFMNKHPGGADYLLQVLGADCEEAMQEHSHSSFSYALLKTFVIGTVEGQKQRQHHMPDERELRGYTAADLDGAVDFSQSTLGQIYNLGDKYWPWLVNRPVCKDNKLIIFPYGFLEALSFYPWWYIWVLWTPIMAYNCYLGYQLTSSYSSSSNNNVVGDGNIKTTVGKLLLSWVVGLLQWTLMEYVLHRFVFHGEVFTGAGNVFHYFAHGIHHLIPTDSNRLAFPPPFAILLGSMFFFLFKVALPSAFLQYNVYFAGFVFGYVMYDTMHFFFHHSELKWPILRTLKQAHLNHHYKLEGLNFGVSSPLWDLVFGTFDCSIDEKGK